MAVRIQFRRGTAAEWAAANPTLAAGELGYEIDTAQIKIGDASTDWANLAYAAVSATYVDDAIANVVGLAPEDLDTLTELASALNNDPNFANTISDAIANAISAHASDGTDVHGIPDTAELETQSGAQAKANLAQTNAQNYADNAIANLIDSSPATLDTLNELAAALGDDPNFATTVSNSLGTKLSFVVDTSTNFDAANAVTDANTVYIISDLPGYIIVGDGVSNFGDLTYVGKPYVDHSFTLHNAVDSGAHGIADFGQVVIRSELSDYQTIANSTSAISGAITSHNAQTLDVHGIANTANLVVSSDLAAYTLLETSNTIQNNLSDLSNTVDTLNNTLTTDYATLDSPTFSGLVTLPDTTDIGNVTSTEISYLDGASSNIQSQLDDKAPIDSPNFSGTVLLPANTSIGGVTSTEIGYLQNVTSGIQSQLDDKAPLDGPTFTGNVVLPETTSIGGVSGTELIYLDNVTSNIQSQLDGKLGISAAQGIYAPLANATLTGTVSLPADTAIGNVTATEISYLETVSSNVQGQLDDKAPKDGPIFTGVVTLPSTTSIGDVSDIELSYLNNVSSNIQEQLDAKLAISSANSIFAPLASPTFTGDVVLPANTSIGLISSTEIEYLDNVSSNIQSQLDDKAPLESPTFTGTVSGVTASMVGLGNVDNTSDLDKPISNATQSALDAKANLSGATFTGDVEAIDLTVTGNLIVQGTTTTVSTADLKVKDNMIHLNQAGLSTITNAVGDGTNVVYTTAEAHGYDVGDDVTVANTTPSSFDIASPGYSIIAVTSNTFTVASTVTDTYVSGGTARGKVHSNPDLGWAAGRYDTVNGSGYAHAGVFRDASDGVFKFFDGYTPEPDESAFINTSDASFALAPLEVSEVTAANLIATTGVVFPDNTVQTSAGVPSLTSFTQKTANYTLDTLAHQDNVVEMNSANAITFTIPLNSTLAWPVGASMDIIQTGLGQVTIANVAGVTLNYTPGNKLRTQWSSCTIMKRGTDSWILYGDLTA